MESDKKSLQQQITSLAQQNKETQQRCDKLEQYGRGHYSRIDSIPKQNNEKAAGFFEFVKVLIEEVLHL